VFGEGNPVAIAQGPAPHPLGLPPWPGVGDKVGDGEGEGVGDGIAPEVGVGAGVATELLLESSQALPKTRSIPTKKPAVA
jgi:hypothetical protein